MRLIDADMLKPDGVCFLPDGTKVPIPAFSQKQIDNAPTVEAESVIRCKDYKVSDTTESNDDFIQIYNGYNISDFTYGRKHVVKFHLVNAKGDMIGTRIAVGYIINSTPSKLYIGNGEDKSFYILPMSDIISCTPVK